jgi:hypothetical protein
MIRLLKLHGLLRDRGECPMPSPRVTNCLFNPLILLLVFFLLGCPVVLPLGGGDVGRRITKNQLAFVRPGITSKSDVIAQLGEPDVIWENERVLAYNWDVIRSKYLVGVLGPGSSPPFGTVENRVHCVLLFRFDPEDRVERFQLTRRPSSDSYGAHLRKWVGQGREQLDSELLAECGE